MEWQIQELPVLCETLQALHFDRTLLLSSQKMEAAGSSETLTSINKAVHHITEDYNLHVHCCENLKAHIIIHNIKLGYSDQTE
jgi:hypothetical protein